MCQSLQIRHFFQPKSSDIFFISPQKYVVVLTRSAFFCFSTFASKFLDKLTDEQLIQYDSLINKPTNDWEIYYWATGEKIFYPDRAPDKEFKDWYFFLFYLHENICGGYSSEVAHWNIFMKK